MFQAQVKKSSTANTMVKNSTPSSHRGCRVQLDNMYGDKMVVDLLAGDTRVRRQQLMGEEGRRRSRDLMVAYDW